MMTKNEVKKRLPEILYSIGVDFIKPSDVQQIRIKNSDIYLKMRDGRDLKLKNAIKVYREVYRAHILSEIYDEVKSMSYKEFEEIVENLDIAKLEVLKNELEEIPAKRGEKRLNPVKDKFGRIIGAIPSIAEQSCPCGEVCDLSCERYKIEGKIPFSKTFEMTIDVKELLKERELEERLKSEEEEYLELFE